MTGFGDARAQNEQLSVQVEVRTVNNRYLKISTRCPDAYAAMESRVESAIRSAIARGTVTVTFRVAHLGDAGCYRLDGDVLRSYWRQLQAVSSDLGVVDPHDIGPLLALPGILAEGDLRSTEEEQAWPLFSSALEAALKKLHAYRAEEGRVMRNELQHNGRVIGEHLDQIVGRAPQVVVELRDRLEERVRELLQKFDAQIDANDLIRELSIIAERCDINEEITRLRCHLEQFDAFLSDETSQGRKLDFLSQEMFREINTIGSKANDATIARSVVEMKAANERIREILQNVE